MHPEETLETYESRQKELEDTIKPLMTKLYESNSGNSSTDDSSAVWT